MNISYKHIFLLCFQFIFLGTISVVPAQNKNGGLRQPEISNLELTAEGKIYPDELLSQMATQETPWFLWVFFNEQITDRLGAPRRFFNQIIFEQDIYHLKDYLGERGYFNAEIDTVVVFSNDKNTVDISVTVKEHYRSVVDTITIAGLENLDGNLRNEILNNCKVKVKEPYARSQIAAEQNRVIRILQNSGYPTASVDDVVQQRFASTNNISIHIRYKPGKKFVFGKVELPKEKADVEDDVLLRQLDFETGQMYNEEKRIESEQNLNRLGLFENVSLSPSFIEDSSETATAPLRITLRTLEFQELTPEFLVVSENNELFSTGFGLSYKHRNLLGDARNFSITANARVNRIEQLNFGGAFQEGLKEPTLFVKSSAQSQLVFPYFYSNRTSAIVSLTGEAEKQPDYTLNTLRARLGFVSKLATYTSLFTDFNIERVDPKFTIASKLQVDDTTKQFNIIEALTLQRDKTNNPFSPSEGFFHSITIEEGGLLSKSVGGLGLPYSEYYKTSILVKHYFSGEKIKSNVLALKFKGGFAELYNLQNSTPVPLPRRFFTGGSGSVRAWKDKTLSSFGDTLIGGNIAFEGSIENRIQLFPNGGILFKSIELERLWTVLFLDFGNTWVRFKNIETKDIALAIGFGLRYETFIGPFRVDAAWRMYDPKAPENERWLYKQTFLRNSYSLVHFGIGHAF